MKELVKINSSGRDVTTSLIVAEVFGKEHSKVCRDIENLSCSETFRLANFGDTPYTHPQNGQTYRMYEMTKDGFSFLVMGYTGEKAGKFKETFINEFNKRENLLKSEDYILMRSQQILQKRIELAEQKVKQLQVENNEQKKLIAQMQKGNDYLNVILESKGTLATTQVAADYGMSAVSFNKRLKEMRIQRKVNGQWILYTEFMGKGYVHSKTIAFQHSDGRPDTRLSTEWTQRGRMFLYNALKEAGILPLIERTA
jgi:hypothetical protein